MTSNRLKVLYIGGLPRSGSTLVGRVFGQLDFAFFAGEVRNIWRFGLMRESTCGCGQPQQSCEFWSTVLKTAYGTLSEEDILVRSSINKDLRIWHVLRSWLPGGEAWLRKKWAFHFENQRKLYHAIQSVSGRRVLVDSSKAPAYAALLALMPEIDLTILHVVRDPRGMAYSWFRTGRRHPLWGRFDGGGDLRFPVGVRQWVLENAMFHLLRRKPGVNYLFVRYEDFMSQAQQTLEAALHLMGEPEPASPLVVDNTIHIEPGHILVGSTSKFDTGDVQLRLADEWQRKMGWLARAQVALDAWPLMLRYGYL